MAHQSPDERISSVRWYHRFEILPGVFTPGSVAFDAAMLLDSIGIPKDMSGKSAIDIGAWDGPMAFELERRGARVIALDVLDPTETAFNVAKELLGSRVEHVRGSVYDLGHLFNEPFDLVCFLGVYYHLTDPFRAFEEVSHVVSADGQVFFEGECLRNYAETRDGVPVQNDLIRQIAVSDLPLALLCPGVYKKSPNWCIPNFACLSGWLGIVGLELVRHYFEEAADSIPPHQRIKGLAVKRRPSIAIEEINQMGRTLIVTGSDFSERTVINFYCNLDGQQVNLGGLAHDGGVKIPTTVEGTGKLRFELPAWVKPGRVLVQALNPPFKINQCAGFEFDVQ